MFLIINLISFVRCLADRDTFLFRKRKRSILVDFLIVILSFEYCHSRFSLTSWFVRRFVLFC